MIYFTKYADKKFDVLNTHKVYIRKEAVERAIKNPEITRRIGKLQTAQRDNLKVVYRQEDEVKKIITFYPV